MDPILLQKQLKDNAADVQDFYRELASWQLANNKKTAPAATTKAKSDGGRRKKSDSKVKTEPSKRSSAPTNYAAWDKFDADDELRRIDDEEADQNRSESELSDECDADNRESAYLEKEQGNKYVQFKLWDQAIKCYTKAIGFFNMDPVFYANRALCYLKKNQFDCAEADCTLSLKLDKTYVKAYQRRAAARTSLNKLSEAQTDLEHVLELEPNNSESRAALAQVNQRLNQTTPSTTKRPLSKFSASRSVSRNKQLITEDTTGNIVSVKPVNKPPHLRSKKALRRLTVTENSTVPSPQQQNGRFPQPHHQNTMIRSDDLKIIEKSVVVPQKPVTVPPKVELVCPKNAVQFTGIWTTLEPIEKYEFLKLIENPEKLIVIFQESLEPSVFSEILEVLVEFFIPRKEEIFIWIQTLPRIKRFSALTLFMSNKDKNYLRKLFDYMEKAELIPKSDLNAVMVKYEI